jgi:hypothetical protein
MAARALALLIVLALGFGLGWQVHGWRAGAAATTHAQAIVAGQRSQAKITARADDNHQRVRQANEVRTRILVQRVPVYVSPTADRRCDVPHGFVRLHDAAAAGDGLPDPAGQSDEAASGLALSAVAATVAENYGTCHQIADQLSALQAWIRDQQDLMETP